MMDSTLSRPGDAIAPPARAIAAMQSVLEVSAWVAASLDLDPLLDRILDAIERLVPTGRASVTLDVPGRDILRIVKVRGDADYVARMLGGERAISGSLTGRTYDERKAFLIEDLLSPTWRHYIYVPPDHPDHHVRFRSGLMVPLVADQCVGTIFLAREGVGQFSSEDLHILTLFAPQVAIAVTNARRYMAVREQADSLQALVRANAAFAAYTESDDAADSHRRAIEMLVEMVRDVVRHDEAQVWWRHVHGEGVQNIARHRAGLPAAPLPDRRFSDDSIGEAMQHAAPMLIPPGDAAPYRIIVPLTVTEATNGALVLERADPPFTAEEFARAQIITQQVAACIERVVFTMWLQEQNAALIAANRHKDAFLTNMSHELRTPLNAVIGFAQLLADGVVTDENDRAAAYTDILESGHHLLTLVNNVLDVARIESGQERLEFESVILAPVIAAVERMCAPLFSAKSQTFTLDLPGDVCPVRADADRLRQILLNLLSNAHKFTPTGGTVHLSAAMASPAWVRIAITDTGIGIAPEHQTLVFEAFRQVETGYARMQQGTGLGLALTKQLVELMGGTITLDSRPGQGSTFTVTLPAAS